MGVNCWWNRLCYCSNKRCIIDIWNLSSFSWTIYDSFVGLIMKNIFIIVFFACFFLFECFNFSIIQYSLLNLRFAASLSTIPSIFFCVIDFIGMNRVFFPQRGSDKPAEVWYSLFGWFFISMVGSILTWWGVSVFIIKNYENIGDGITKIFPVFVAGLTLIIRLFFVNIISKSKENV